MMLEALGFAQALGSAVRTIHAEVASGKRI
jgi:hypothetical protein